MKNNIKIIKAREKHIPDINSLWWEFIMHHAKAEPFFTPMDDAATGFEKEFLRPALKNRKGRFLIALCNDKPVGYIYARIQEIPYKNNLKIGYVDHLSVSKKYRRRGIGEALYAEIIKWFRLKDIRRIHLELTANNRAACAFWRKQGYRDFQHTWYREI